MKIAFGTDCGVCPHGSNAKEFIYFRIFIFDNDDYALKIADILKRKSNEGVTVPYNLV